MSQARHTREKRDGSPKVRSGSDSLSAAACGPAPEKTETCVECEYLRGGVEGVPVELRGEVGVAVVHTHGVHLLFVALDAVGRANVVTEDPGFSGVDLAGGGVGGASRKEGRIDRGEISVD